MIVVFGMLKVSRYHILLSDAFCVSIFVLFIPFTPFHHHCEQYISGPVTQASRKLWDMILQIESHIGTKF